MSDWLLVRLARDGNQPTGWLRVASSGELLDAQPAVEIAELAAAAVGRRVVLVAPGSDVLQLAASLPAGTETRLAQVVPYALEEQVSEDLDSLHFAVGHTLGGPGTATCVDVVARARLTHWLEVAAALDLAPVAVYADSELVPVIPGHVTALLEDELLTLRVDASRPLQLPAQDPALALELALGSDADKLRACHFTLYTTSIDWARHAPAFESLRPRLASLKVQLLTAGALPLFGTQLLQAGAINLLQGPYAPARPGGFHWRAWRLAAGLAVGLLALHLVAEGLQLRRLAATDKSLDASLQQTFAQAMPGEIAGNSGRKRMEQRLAQLQGAAAERGSLLPLLSALAVAHAAAPGTRVDALSYRKGSLDLKVSGPDAESLERMNQSLRAAGLGSDLASGSTRGQSYEGRLQIRSSGS
jgi:general secretion pathway protein L